LAVSTTTKGGETEMSWVQVGVGSTLSMAAGLAGTVCVLERQPSAALCFATACVGWWAFSWLAAQWSED
jgi:hypothetical protein